MAVRNLTHGTARIARYRISDPGATWFPHRAHNPLTLEARQSAHWGTALYCSAHVSSLLP